MRILKKFVVLDAADIDTEARFWADVLGGNVVPSYDDDYPRWRDIVLDGETVLAVQHAPDHIAPQWPGTDPDRQQQPLHWDLYVAREEVDAASREVRDLGARPVQPASDPDAPHGFHVFADPAGHPFCICWG